MQLGFYAVLFPLGTRGTPFPQRFLPDSVYWCILYGFDVDMQYECDNAFPNLKCVPSTFFLENALTLPKSRMANSN